MKSIFSVLGISFVSLLLFSGEVVAASSTDISDSIEEESDIEVSSSSQEDFVLSEVQTDFVRAKVVKVLEDGTIDFFGEEQPYQRLLVQISEGENHGEQIELELGAELYIQEEQKLEEGTDIVLRHSFTEDGSVNQYVIQDPYRLGNVYWFVGLFIMIVVIIAGWAGARALAGMGLGLVILVHFIAGNIADGSDPLIISWLGAVLIAVSSMVLSHGWNKKIFIAVGSTLTILLISVLLSELIVSWTRLYGLGSDDAQMLEFTLLDGLDLRGVFLAGIVIGVLGVLDDVTTAQTAMVYELQQANPRLSFVELYRRGLRVGREHVVALVNTLVLAYAGAFFPLFLILTVESEQPLWVTLNSEFMMEEIVRTLIGSITLVLAVPLTTVAAAYAFGVRRWTDAKTGR